MVCERDMINCACFCVGLFEVRLEEYRQEMEQYSPGLRRNVKDVGKRLKNFFVESGRL